MFQGMISPQQMKLVNMALASYLVYYFFFKGGVRHNAQAVTAEMLESIGLLGGGASPTQKYVIAALLLAYLFKDQLPVLGEVFSQLGFSAATPLTRLVDPKSAAVTDVKSVMKKESDEKKGESMQQKIVPPPAVQGPAAFLQKPDAPSSSAAASTPGGSLAQNFMQPVV